MTLWENGHKMNRPVRGGKRARALLEGRKLLIEKKAKPSVGDDELFLGTASRVRNR